jgi:triosephosphate isomerase
MKDQALLGAQDCSAHERGAYTGEVSAAMLAAMGCRFSLVGHSERRLYHGETSAQGGLKIRRLQEQGLMAVYCVGESLEQRQSEAYAMVIEAQLQEALGGEGLSLDPSALGFGLRARLGDWYRTNGNPSTSQRSPCLDSGLDFPQPGS